MKPMVLMLASTLLLFACRDTSQLPDTRIAHPVRVESKTFSLAVPAQGPADSAEQLQLRTFARDYLRRGRSALEIVQPGEGTEAIDGVSAIQRALEAEGVRRDLMIVSPGEGGSEGEAPPIVLSYRGFDAVLPDCPDWSSQSGFTPSNYPHTNFGCSMRRNIGMMLSDPGDLVAPRVMDPVTGGESDRVIGLYRKGEPTPAKVPEGTKGTVSSVGNK